MGHRVSMILSLITILANEWLALIPRLLIVFCQFQWASYWVGWSWACFYYSKSIAVCQYWTIPYQSSDVQMRNQWWLWFHFLLFKYSLRAQFECVPFSFASFFPYQLSNDHSTFIIFFFNSYLCDLNIFLMAFLLIAKKFYDSIRL